MIRLFVTIINVASGTTWKNEKTYVNATPLQSSPVKTGMRYYFAHVPLQSSPVKTGLRYYFAQVLPYSCHFPSNVTKSTACMKETAFVNIINVICGSA